MFECPAPLVNTSTFLAKDSFLFISKATITVIVIATFKGIVVKSLEIIPTPKRVIQIGVMGAGPTRYLSLLSP